MYSYVGQYVLDWGIYLSGVVIGIGVGALMCYLTGG